MHELAPAAPLRDTVVRAVDFRERATGGVRRVEAPLLGAVVLIALGPDIEVSGERTGSFAAGVWDRPVVTGHFGEQAGYMLYLAADSARRLLGVPMCELANRLVALEDLMGPLAGELAERLAAADGPAGRHAVAQELLVARLADGPGCGPEVAWALRRLRAARGSVRVETLADEIGWSRRHLTARFRAEVGLAPKAVARVARAEHAAALLGGGSAPADVAFAAGYADQPHLNRDFRDLVGCTPAEFAFVQDALPVV